MLLTFVLSAAQTASIGRTADIPKIDGNSDDDCWKYTQELTGMTIPIRLVYAEEQTSLRLCYDNNNLYGFATCYQKSMNHITTWSKTHDDPEFWRGNCIEMFFLSKFPESENTFSFKQISFNAEDTVFDNNYDVVNGKSKGGGNEWESGITLTAKKYSDRWTVEFSIPWKKLGIMPKPGNSFTFNFIRSNPANCEQSSWSRLEKYNWHQPMLFSKIKICSQVNGFVFRGLPQLNPISEFILETNTQAGMKPAFNLNVCKRQIKGEIKGKNQLKFSYRVPSNASTNGYCRLTVNTGKEQLYSFSYQPLEKYIHVFINNTVDDKKLFLSDLRPAQLVWNMQHSFPIIKRVSGGKIKKDYEIIYELPEGISLSCSGKKGKNIQKIGGIVVYGKKYNQYSQKFSYAYNATGWLASLLKTTLPAGTKGKIRYYAKWDNKVQAAQEANFEVIKIQEVKAPKRFLVGMYNFWPQTYADAANDIKCGMNIFAIEGSSSRLLKLAKQLKKNGYYIMRGPYYWPSGKAAGWEYWTSKDRTARAKDIDGYYISNGNAFQLSPSYRGRMIKEAIEKELIFLKEAGINYFSFDMEDYIQPNGDKGDFHERTINEFKKYFANNYPEMKYIDPHKFERKPGKYPAYHTAWVKFKAWIWADFFISMKKELAVIKDKSCPYPGIIFTEWSFPSPWDEKKLNKHMRGKEWYSKAFDFIETSNYTSIDRTVRELNNTFQELATKMPDLNVKFIFTPAPVRIKGGYFKTNAPPLKNEFKYSCMEAAGFGFKGIHIWYSALANLDTYRQLTEALKIIKKTEDIIIDGKRIKKISCNQPYNLTIKDYFHGKLEKWENEPRVFVKGLELKNQALICVSEYREQKQMTIKVNYTPKTDVKIVDLETNQILGNLKVNEKSFDVTLEPERRCKLLLLQSLTNEIGGNK